MEIQFKTRELLPAQEKTPTAENTHLDVSLCKVLKKSSPKKPINFAKCVCEQRFSCDPDTLWQLVSNPGLLVNIPTLSDWNADGELRAGQTGTEVHSFLPYFPVIYFWKMKEYSDTQRRWAMMSRPVDIGTFFNFPHYTSYTVRPAIDGSELRIFFIAELNGIFKPLAPLVKAFMPYTIRMIFKGIEEKISK